MLGDQGNCGKVRETGGGQRDCVEVGETVGRSGGL